MRIGISPSKNLVHVTCGAAVQVDKTRPIGREAADLHKFPNAMDRRESICGREVRNLLSMINGEGIFNRNQGV